MKKSIKILVVDDSALIRQTLSKVISSFDDMEVIGVAADPYMAVQKMKSEKPDVITLDIQMPRMDGLTFLKKIMTQHPIPVVVISSLSKKDSKIALTAYKLGAIDVIEKPVLTSDILHKEWKERLFIAIKSASNSILSRIVTSTPTVTTNNNLIAKGSNKVDKNINNVVLIGSSAGGTEVINKILSSLDINTAPILIVQHMPELFTGPYASRLNSNSIIEVKEACTGDKLKRGFALLSPGNDHMELKNSGHNFFVSLNKDEKVNRHRPSVDVLFESALKFPSLNILAIILSGMGTDGSISMLKLKNNGAKTVAQSKESSIVYGMPREALRIGAAESSLSIKEIINTIKAFSEKQ